MPKINSHLIDSKSSQIDLNQERFFSETLLSQRIHFFIIMFVVILTGSILTANFANSYLVLVLSVGTIITWGLTLTILRLSLRIRFINKQLGNAGLNIISSFLKLPFKILGWFSDIFIPIVCSLILTAGLILSTTGYFDAKLIPEKVKEGIEDNLKIKSDTIKKPKEAERIKEFRIIDSVIQK